MAFVKNIKETFGTDASVAVEADRGDLVQTVLITAGFAVAAILVIAWISSTVAAKGSEISDCIGSSGNFNKGANVKACEPGAEGKGVAAAKTNDGEFSKRFGATATP